MRSKVGGLVLAGTVGVDNFRDRFRDISVPVLIAWGEQDQVSSPENAYFLEKEISDARLLMLSNARHPCYLDKPDVWHNELIRFLSSDVD